MVTVDDSAPNNAWTLFDSGRRCLKERLYHEAESCFTEYLSREPKAPKTAETRARAHCLIALTILARTPPLSRSSSEIDKVTSRLQNASRLPLAGVLARIVVETFYHTDNWNIPDDLAKLAERHDVHQLDGRELKLLVKHLPGTFGPTWDSVRREAGLHEGGPGAPEVVVQQKVDEWRRTGVPRYFAVIPAAPPEPEFRKAWILAGVGGACLLAPLGGLLVTTAWYIGLAFFLVMLSVAAALLYASILAFRESGRRRRLVRKREAAIRASTPRPSDAQMDEWLMQDVEAAVRRGAERHRLDLGDSKGGMVILPQVVVGISRIPSRLAIESILGRARGADARRMGFDRLPLAKSRVGRDGRLRSSHYHILVVYLTKRRFGIYECDVSLATRERLAEGTQSFNYADVVTLSSRKLTSADDGRIPNVLVDGEGQSRTVRGGSRFLMTLVNGHEIEVRTAVAEKSGVEQAMSVAWDNEPVQRSIERMVWAMKDSRAF